MTVGLFLSNVEYFSLINPLLCRINNSIMQLQHTLCELERRFQVINYTSAVFFQRQPHIIYASSSTVSKFPRSRKYKFCGSRKLVSNILIPEFSGVFSKDSQSKHGCKYEKVRPSFFSFVESIFLMSRSLSFFIEKSKERKNATRCINANECDNPNICQSDQPPSLSSCFPLYGFLLLFLVPGVLGL